jgi:MoaA/NifB/PqqE/SkfB family radical SAM enzyme
MGFPHAGEPLLAPMLEPMLVALQDARAGEATQVHVLTNTLALSLDRFIELVGLGVSSWSFSIDGMSAASNDWLRQGAKVERALELIRRCSEWRQHNSVDVRTGIACTVHQRNLSELDAMVNFVHDAGLDWLKLEEMYPVNSLSQELATMDAEQLRTALAAAAELAKTLGVKLLFHIDELDARRCLCDDNPRVQQFCELDSFANRMDIHACRLPWELVCIEPNGDVKPLSFHHPVAGNILKQDLMHIWNSPGFVSVRQQVNARCVHQLHQRNCTAASPGPQHW